MRKLTVALTAFLAVAGWVQAHYWRERAHWASQADIDELTAKAFVDAIEEDAPTEEDSHSGFASAFVVRATTPPDANLPWFAASSWTDFDTDMQGFRIVNSASSWVESKQAGHDFIVSASKGRTRLDDVPEF